MTKNFPVHLTEYLSYKFKTCGRQVKDVGHFPLTKCLCPQYVPRVPGMSPGHQFQTKNGLISTFLNHANRPNERYFTTPQNLKGEHSFVGAPASLYNLTKRAPDPLLR